MGEMLLEQQRENLPVVIIRPTMVTSTYQDPFPGWIEGARYDQHLNKQFVYINVISILCSNYCCRVTTLHMHPSWTSSQQIISFALLLPFYHQDN
jgi:hypothetical protein